MNVIFNQETFTFNSEITLGEFVRENDFDNLPGSYLLNGEAKSEDDNLFNYCVVERSYSLMEEFLIRAETEEAVPEKSLVNIHLIDFTGFAQFIDVSDNIQDLSERYSQPITARVYRGSVEIDPKTENEPDALWTGDRVIITPAGGVKGA